MDSRLFPIAIWNLADRIGSGHCLFYRAGNIFECGYGKYWGEDPSRVVIDEMVGVWIPLLVVPDGGWWYVVAAFALFRFFDIVKPLGVRRMERFRGGVGIMMDDILAGIYSAILLGIIRLSIE